MKTRGIAFTVAFALLALLAALPAAAQPYATVGDALFALGCRTNGVCDPARQCPHLDVRPFNPALSGWPRYGHASRPVHISDGSESKGLVEAKMIIASPGNPLRLAHPPERWTAIVGQDEMDLSIVRCGAQSAKQMIISRFGAPAPACSPGWNCVNMPVDVAQRCVDGTLRCTGLDFGPGSRLCWLAQASRITFNAARSDCVPESVVVPPPSPDLCGDSRCADGETCSTCQDDCGSCPPPPPPPPPPEGDACEELRRAVEAVCPVSAYRPGLPSTGRLENVLVPA